MRPSWSVGVSAVAILDHVGVLDVCLVFFMVGLEGSVFCLGVVLAVTS